MPTFSVPGGFVFAGHKFDNIPRQEDLDEKTEWDARKDYGSMYSLLTNEMLEDIRAQAERYYRDTNYAVIGNYSGGGLGDIFHVPGPWLKQTKGIREVEDWYMAVHLHREYIMDLFAMQTELTLKNMHLYYQAAGNKIQVMAYSGTDFAFQTGQLISNALYREIYMPYYKQVNDWIHQNTDWKTFMHSCGSVTNLIPEFVEAGFDILNPVQVSAKDMQPQRIKEAYGDQIVFWGGGCDPQNLLPNGTPQEVYDQAKQNAEIFAKGGGFVGGNVHNIQYGVPIDNVLAEFCGLRDACVCK